MFEEHLLCHHHPHRKAFLLTLQTSKPFYPKLGQRTWLEYSHSSLQRLLATTDLALLYLISTIYGSQEAVHVQVWSLLALFLGMGILLYCVQLWIVMSTRELSCVCVHHYCHHSSETAATVGIAWVSALDYFISLIHKPVQGLCKILKRHLDFWIYGKSVGKSRSINYNRRPKTWKSCVQFKKTKYSEAIRPS